MKFKEYNQNQPWLIPPNIEEEIPAGDICRVIDEVVDLINISSIEDKYGEEGNPAYHPRMMLKVLFYSYSRGVFSSRIIAQELERNIFYWYLSGKQNPDFRTICLFRTRHAVDLKEIFCEIVKYCLNLGIARISTVTLDGTKIKANANRDKMRSKEWLEKQIKEEAACLSNALDDAEKIDAEEDEKYGKDKRGDEIPEARRNRKARLKKLGQLKKELEEKKRRLINETDTEAGLMRSQGTYLAGYNCQAVVDTQSQIILEANVSNESNDWHQLKDNLEEVKRTYSQKPAILLADAGYCSGENLRYLKEETIEGVIPDKSIKNVKAEIGPAVSGKRFNKDDFKYNKKTDCYVCPEGRALRRQGDFPAVVVRKSGERVQYFQYQCFSCQSCRVNKECCHNKRGRCITRYFDEDLREEMAAKIRSKAGYELYKQRFKTAEPVFGNLKQNIGFRGFSLRGLIKTRGEFFIIATVHNLIKIKNLTKGLNGGINRPVLCP